MAASEPSELLGVVNYVRNPRAPGEEPLEFVSEEEARSTMQTLPGREASITNARGIHTSLDREGFQLVSHVSAIKDFDGIELDPARNETYTEELCDLLQAETGASLVIPLGGAKQRFGERAAEQLASLVNAKPARYPHADNTDASSDTQIKMFVDCRIGRNS